GAHQLTTTKLRPGELDDLIERMLRSSGRRVHLSQPFVDAMLGAVYVLTIVGLTFVRAMRGAVDVARGFARYRRAARVDWRARLVDLERAMDGRAPLPVPLGARRVVEP
ncbi:hypothetical protein KCW65_22875, partial [Mycobacterium tuberculosis]|nr:hypothetical protein [Mycobacterium tuberculosis]